MKVGRTMQLTASPERFDETQWSKAGAKMIYISTLEPAGLRKALKKELDKDLDPTYHGHREAVDIVLDAFFRAEK